MALFTQDLALPVWFGDFGGDLSTGDLDTRPACLAAQARRLMIGDAFEEEFWRVIELIAPGEPAVRRAQTRDGLELICVPDDGWKYNLAGQLALARLRGANRLCAGTFQKDYALAAAAACKALGLELSLMLSRALGQDDALVEQLKACGCRLDVESCVSMYDLPHLYAPKIFPMAEPGVEAFAFTANYGDYPAPALAGALAGIYGKRLKTLVGVPDAVVVPITEGTGAVAVLQAYLKERCVCTTVEQPIAQEYHNGETLVTRAADEDAPNTVLCPELAWWWRSAKVLRLGCDRMRPVDADAFLALGLSAAAARGAALAAAAVPGCKTMMIVEG